MPPGDGQFILGGWAGGHVAPGPQAAPAARRATSQSLNVIRDWPARSANTLNELRLMIPDFQSVMRPLLEHLSDGTDHPNSETLEALAAYFDVTADERAELLL